MKRQDFFHLAEFQNEVFCFAFQEMFSSLLMLLVMLFVHGAKRSNSRSKMFLKTGVLKNFAIFTGKHLCLSLF